MIKNLQIRCNDWSKLEVLLLFLLATTVVTRGYAALFYQINWDEFYFLSKLYLFKEGSLTKVLQNGHVYLFWWLPSLTATEIGQIRIARLCMLVFHVMSLWLWFALLKDLFCRASALFSLLFYSSVGYVVCLSTNFRADPILLSLYSVVVYQLYFYDPRNKITLVSSIALAFSLLVSIKAILFLPVIMSLAIVKILYDPRKKVLFLHYLKLLLVAALSFGIMYVVHKSMLSADAPSGGGQTLIKSFDRVVTDDRVVVRKDIWMDAMFSNQIYLVVLIVSVVSLIAQLLVCKDLKKSAITLIFCIPILYLFLYQNAYSYFYPLALISVSCVFGYFYCSIRGAVDISKLLSTIGLFVVFFCIVLVSDVFSSYLIIYAAPAVVSLFVLYLSERVGILTLRQQGLGVVLIFLVFASQWNLYQDGVERASAINMDYQRQVLNVVHKMFPEKVSYIDGTSMVSSFKNAGFLMSTWGLDIYRNREVAVLKEAVIQKQPKFLIANTSTGVIRRAMNGEARLLQQDTDVLRENYIHHWGPIYIAGKQVLLGAGAKITVEFLVEGVYTLHSKVKILLDGKPWHPGETVNIRRGVYEVYSENADTHDIRIKYGNHVYLPQVEPLGDKVYEGF